MDTQMNFKAMVFTVVTMGTMSFLSSCFAAGKELVVQECGGQAGSGAASKASKCSVAASFAGGCAAGVLEVTVDQPLVVLKNWVQQHKFAKSSGREFTPFPRDPRTWYRGYMVNAGSMGPITAIQMGMNAFFASMLVEDGQALSRDKAMFCAALAGAVSASVSSPADYTVLCQGNSGKAFCSTAQELMNSGMRGLYRGFVPTALRDANFSMSLLFVAPLMERAMLQQLGAGYEPCAIVASGVVTGVGAALFTQPWDVVATAMRSAHPTANVRDTMRRLYTDGGMLAFWSGGCARGLRVVLAITLMNAVQGPLTRGFSWLDF